MRWVLLVIGMFGFAFALRATTPSMLGWSLFVGCVGLIGSVLGFIASRVGAVSQGQHMREQAFLSSSTKPPAAAPQRRPPPANPSR